MTTEPREQHEPSMEEILSSIRRIIADEETEDSNDTDELGAAEARAEALDDDVDVMADAADDDAEDVLELTKMVRDGGEVVDLRADETPEAPEPEPGPEAAQEPAAAAVEEEPTPKPTFAAADDDEIELAPAAETDSAASAGDDATTRESKDVQSHQASAELVSSTAATVATGAFAKLSQAIQKTPAEESVADDSGRSVEQFVEDMARPLLKDWLDEHLPQIVERLVEKEIQKIARRAELM